MPYVIAEDEKRRIVDVTRRSERGYSVPCIASNTNVFHDSIS